MDQSDARRTLRDFLKLAFFPRRPHDLDNVARVIEAQIIGAYAPDGPPLSPQSKIACLGSCFAGEIAKSLQAQGRNVIPIFMGEQWATTFAVKHFIEYGLQGIEPPEGYLSDHPPLAQAMLKAKRLADADVFIITFGMSLCWFHRDTNRMVLDIKEGHTASSMEEALLTHVMRQTTVAENEAAIMDVVSAIRTTRPDAPIIITLSPVPLLASMTDYPVVASNNISKATLRAALHNITARNIAGLYYWPSYDIVEWLAKYKGPLFGQEGADLRHLSGTLISQIMAWFSRYYFQQEGRGT